MASPLGVNVALEEETVFPHPGNPEVAQFDNPVSSEKNVLRLEVSVEHILLMHVPQSQAYLHKNSHDLSAPRARKGARGTFKVSTF